MVAEVFAGIGAFNSMFSIAKSLKDMNDAAVRNAAVSELWEQIITAQTRYSEAIEKVHDLEKQLSKFETWEAEKKRYHLQKLPPGVFVYVLKREMANGEPAHRLCAKCYQNNKKSILQESGSDYMKCHECGSEFYPYGNPGGSVTHDYDPLSNE